MESFLQIAPHSLAMVLTLVGTGDSTGVSESEELPRHHTGYDIFADFKNENTQHVWNKIISDAISETFFLGWIDKHVLVIQGKEDHHLEVLREGWMRRSLNPPRGFDIKYLNLLRAIMSLSSFGKRLCELVRQYENLYNPSIGLYSGKHSRQQLEGDIMKFENRYCY